VELARILLESVEFPQKFLSQVGGKGDLGHEERNEVKVGETCVGEQEAVVPEFGW
jgi:hypothetical protein